MPKDKEWWYTDDKGRKIGWIWPEDMLAVLESIWGKRKGIGGFANYAGFTRTAVEQWCNGRSPVSKHVALLVEMMQREVISRQRQNRNKYPYAKLPNINASWFSGTEKRGLARNPFG